MKYPTIVIIAFSLLSLVSCASLEIKQDEIDSWLISISGDSPSKIDVAGDWRDPDSISVKSLKFTGWGDGYIRQNQNKLKGAIGGYNVKGIVSGEIVYLVFYTGGIVYYTARLEVIDDGELAGEYFEADDREQKRGSPTMFRIE